MAEKHHPSTTDEPRGTMDIDNHVKTWLAFWSATKWSVILLILLAAILLIFRTNDGV